MWKLRGFDITRAQLGWQCWTYFRVTTAGQFTDEEHHVTSGHRYLLVALLLGWWEARKHARQLAAKPGEREANGWAA